VRKCFVVRVDGEGEIPALADWGGACDVFFYRVGGKDEDTKMANGRKIDLDDSQTETTQEEALAETSGLNTPIVVPQVEMTREITSASLALENVENSSLRATPALMTLSEDSGSTEAISTEVVETVCVSAEPVARESVPPDSVSAEPPPPAEIKFENIPEDRKLRGLDLFCGGGNFGRGVSGGGAVHHKWYPFSCHANSGRSISTSTQCTLTKRISKKMMSICISDRSTTFYSTSLPDDSENSLNVETLISSSLDLLVKVSQMPIQKATKR
jgi:hypothetical protein